MHTKKRTWLVAKRKTTRQYIEALEQYHNTLQPAYNVHLAFSTDGYARFGTGVAVRADVEVLSVTDSPTGEGPEEQGRFCAVELQTVWVVSVYTHNKDDDGSRQKLLNDMTTWATQQNKPIVWMLDSNQVDSLEHDIKIHFPGLAASRPRPEIKDFITPEGGPIINTNKETYGVGLGPIFEKSRAAAFKDFMQTNGVEDAAQYLHSKDQHGMEYVMEHTSHWPFLNWRQYKETHPKKNQYPWSSGRPPMCTSRIDVCAANPTLTPIEDLEVIKNPESTGDMTEAAQLKASYMSDHYIVRVQLQVPKLAQHRAAQPCNYTKATLMQLHSATKELEQGAVCTCTCIRTGCEATLTQSLGQGAKDHMCCSLECEQALMVEQEREAQTFWNKVSTKYRRMLTCEAQLVQQHDKREKLVEVLSWGHEDIIESWVQDTQVVSTEELVEATVQCAIHTRQSCIEQGIQTE